MKEFVEAALIKITLKLVLQRFTIPASTCATNIINLFHRTQKKRCAKRKIEILRNAKILERTQ